MLKEILAHEASEASALSIWTGKLLGFGFLQQAWRMHMPLTHSCRMRLGQEVYETEEDEASEAGAS